MLVIGEKINASNRSVGEAIARRDADFIIKLVKDQTAAGADFIDVNAGARTELSQSETAAMEWLVDIVQTSTDKPLAIDSESPDVIAAALSKYKGSDLMINSVSAEKTRLEPVGKLAAKHNARLVALAMGEGGIPETTEARLAACEIIMDYLTQMGVAPGNVYFDPLVLPVSVDAKQGLVTLKTIEQIKSHYPAAKTVMGLSNVSYGFPERKLINRSFLVMAAYAGLDAAILDPLDTKMMSMVKVADMLTGRESSRGYLRAYRRGAIVG
ncbi:MAG: dihydropteroate synthase [Dehalococcoidales bacterium]|nr:dihydropteroate synthase [Dehalococcoidales bacterium]